MTDEPRDETANDDLATDGLQNAPVHEGGGPAPTYDTNEHADDKVDVLQPSGDVAPKAGEDDRG